MPATVVTRTHLELPRPYGLRRARIPSDPLELVRRRPIDTDEYRALYRLVGDRWFWRDRLAWADEELDRYLGSSHVHIWTLQVRGATAGYFELQQRSDAAVEIMYFGLAAEYIGRGLGGWMLTRAVDEAFALGAGRVALNTCTLDGPHALPNYLARGFAIMRQEEYFVDLSDARDSCSG